MRNNTSTIDLAAIQRLLAEAGIPAIPVEGCADEQCPWCLPSGAMAA